jgi:hypothetical protein
MKKVRKLHKKQTYVFACGIIDADLSHIGVELFQLVACLFCQLIGKVLCLEPKVQKQFNFSTFQQDKGRKFLHLSTRIRK